MSQSMALLFFGPILHPHLLPPSSTFLTLHSSLSFSLLFLTLTSSLPSLLSLFSNSSAYSFLITFCSCQLLSILSPRHPSPFPMCLHTLFLPPLSPSLFIPSHVCSFSNLTLPTFPPPSSLHYILCDLSVPVCVWVCLLLCLHVTSHMLTIKGARSRSGLHF